MKADTSTILIRPRSIDDVSVAERRTRVLLVFWPSVALLLTITLHVAGLNRPFDRTDWISAHFSTMARSFVEHGIIALRGVPIQNNSPIGLEPDAYIHWPPLFPILLSFLFRFFGASEPVAHALMLVLALANAGALYALVKECCGRQTALWSVFASLVIPVTYGYGRLVLHLHLAIFGMLLALLAFVKSTNDGSLNRRWAAFGALALAFGALTSWEALLICPALLAVSLWHRNRTQIRLALVYSGVGVVVTVGLLTTYLIKAPELLASLTDSIRYYSRSQMVRSAEWRTNIHSVVGYEESERPSVKGLLSLMAIRFGELLGPFAGLAVGGLLIAAWMHRRRRGNGVLFLMFGGLIAPWLLWFVIMAQHAYHHEYQWVLAVPGISAAMGIGIVTLTNMAGNDGSLRAVRSVTLLVLPTIMLLPLARQTRNLIHSWDLEMQLVDYGHAVEANTEPGAIVMQPYASMVPVYHSKRHMIRGVLNDSIVDIVAQRAPDVFPGSNLYLALDPADAKDFSASLARYTIVKQSKDFILLRLPSRTGAY